MPKSFNARKTWLAMRKFADDESLTSNEWEALSWLTLINRNNLYFGPENCRWARSEAERADNLAFFKSLGPSVH
jgi:hypothetical protein